MMYPLVRELAVDGVPVTVTCRVLKIARQPYYRWLEQPVSDRLLDEAYLANVVFDAHRDDPEFGYRFLADEARHAGQAVCDRTVWRVCRDNQWWSVFGKPRRGKGSKPGTPAHDDLVRREFTATALNRLWLTDITEHHTAEGKLYLCAIKDVCSNRIVGYSIDSRMKARLAVAALDSAVARRDGDVAGCILHSDRGSQGGFNWSSQHLDDGGVCWGPTSRRRCVCIGGRSRRRAGRRSLGGGTVSGSGLRSLGATRPRTPRSKRVCHPQLRSGGSVTLVA
jgi:putative transposase